MSWGFERGRVYNRRADIHSRFGGQMQGGIVTPSAHALIIIITGEEGLAHGYADKLRDDGVFDYYGEGQSGDMQFIRGNRKIRDHAQDGRDLLLFRKTRAGLRFEGEFVFESYRIERGTDSSGVQRNAIVFELRPLEALAEAVDATPPAPFANLQALKDRAFAAANPAPSSTQRMRTVVERSKDVKEYIVRRGAGVCEGCGSNAPFLRPDGVPYLEPHHIRRLSDGGPDDPRFVIALCPNCHRRIHSGADGTNYNKQMLTKMKVIEP